MLSCRSQRHRVLHRRA